MSALITYKLKPRINPVYSSPFPLKRGTFVLFVIRVHKKNLVFTRRISCSQEESRILQSLPAQAWKIRVIRVIRVHKKNLVFSSPFPRKRGKFVLFALFVFTRKISCSPVPSRASVENSCYSRYSCSQEKSRVHKKIIRVPIRMQK